MPIDLPKPVLDILQRDLVEPAPEKVACVPHRHVPLLERPIDCALCAYDVRAALRHALAVNEWLDKWRTEIVKALDEAQR